MPNGPKLIQTETAAVDVQFPAAIMMKLAKANPPVTVEGLSDQGDLRFVVRRSDIGLSGASATRTPMVWSDFFIELMGEVLVRKNIAQFADLLAGVEPGSYGRVVNTFEHRGFGLEIEDDGRLRFQCHVSLIQSILIEDLGPLFKPTPKN